MKLVAAHNSALDAALKTKAYWVKTDDTRPLHEQIRKGNWEGRVLVTNGERVELLQYSSAEYWPYWMPIPALKTKELEEETEDLGRETPTTRAGNTVVGKATLEALKDNPEIRAEWACDRVLIWSGEHGAWWRDGGAGYTCDSAAAGVYDFTDAWAHTSHCGPEKQIVFQRLAFPSVSSDGKASTASELQAQPNDNKLYSQSEFDAALEVEREKVQEIKDAFKHEADRLIREANKLDLTTASIRLREGMLGQAEGILHVLFGLAALQSKDTEVAAEEAEDETKAGDKVSHLLFEWEQRRSQYGEISLTNRKHKNDLDASRYEGIATGTRWCLEDLQKRLGNETPLPLGDGNKTEDLNETKLTKGVGYFYENTDATN